LFFACSYLEAIWWDVCDICDISRIRKNWDEWIRWVAVSNFSRKVGFAATMYCVWQEQNSRIFAGISRNSNLVFDQIKGIIHDKLNLMRNVPTTNENIKIQRAWKANNVES
jgi:hypothetical protein